MNEYDIIDINCLISKAVEVNRYDIAAKLRDARELLKDWLNDKWSDEILNKIDLNNREDENQTFL